MKTASHPVSQVSFPIKRGLSFLEKWLIPSLGQGSTSRHLVMCESKIVLNGISKGHRSSLKGIPPRWIWDNLSIRKNSDGNELQHSEVLKEYMSLYWFSGKKGREAVLPEEYQLINIKRMLQSENHHYAINNVKTDSDKDHRWMLQEVMGDQDIFIRLCINFERESVLHNAEIWYHQPGN